MASNTAAPKASVAVRTQAPVWAIFGCDGRAFGFTLERVREILLPRPFTRLPGCGPEVCGLIGLRGRIVTVFDIGAALGLRPAAARPDHRMLLIECGDRLIAGAVEEVAAIRPLEVRELGRRRAPLKGLKIDRAAVLGYGTTDGRPFLGLDSDRILGDLLLRST